MHTLSYVGLLGGVFSLMGYVPYARSIIKGEAEPERARWLIIALSNMLILLSYFVLGARTTIWVPAAYALGTSIIAVLSLVYGRSGWGLIEKYALVIAIIGAIRWVLFDNVFLALILTMTVGFLSYAKVFRNLISDNGQPSEREDVVEWSMFFLGSVLNLIAVSSWSYQIATLPILIFIMNGAVLAVVLYNSLKHENDSHIS